MGSLFKICIVKDGNIGDIVEKVDTVLQARKTTNFGGKDMANITDRIQSANQAVSGVAISFATAVSHSGFRNADFAAVFEVRMDDNVQNARTGFNNERRRVEQEITDRQRDIQNTQNQIDELNRRIRTLDSNISTLNQNIRTATNRADDFRRQANRTSSETEREELLSRARTEDRNRQNFEAQRNTYGRNRDTAVGQKNTANNNLSNLRGSTRALEDRLRDIERIINMF